MKKYLFLFLFVFSIVYGDQTNEITKKIFIESSFENWTTDFFSAISNGKIVLKHSVLYQDEEGRTHYSNIEKINSDILAKKQFFIKNHLCSKAELFAFHASNLNLEVNGKKVKEGKILPSTGWFRWDIPVEFLKDGLNEFIFSGSGTLLIEPSLYPNRSARSFDGGKTWDFDTLGVNCGNGEYVVRLRLEQYPEKGIATGEVNDLLSFAEGNFCVHGNFIIAKNIQLSCTATIPPKTEINFQYRTGDTKIFQPKRWSSWTDFKRKKNMWVIDQPVSNRFLQIRAILKTLSPDRAPVIENIVITADVKYTPPGKRFVITQYDNPEIINTSLPFAYQEPNYRTRALRKMYGLDDVIKGGNTELEKFVMLRNWARHTAPKGWDWGTGMWCPPWDALVILATNKQPVALCMCTHYSTIFTQCAVALGYVARQVILDHHCVSEIWSDQFGKWILMDTGNSQNPEMNCHFEHNGVPLNALEIRKLWKENRQNEIKPVYANEAMVSEKEKKEFESTIFNVYRRFAIPLRNNFLGNPEPGEPEQGQSEYYCDLYLWWEDSPEPRESPEYGKTSNRVGDFYWSINRTMIDLVYVEGNTIAVNLYHNTPNFSHYLVSIDNKEWKKSPEHFVWTIHPGRNELIVRAVNAYGHECPVSKVIIED
ncbi:MAG: transglutaminase-like domain-containing protein [Candidatus Omnitrophica bacterium]|nr:transglutaminase-like domain-containing protein [Candidatus Omnitrophota bacterium]